MNDQTASHALTATSSGTSNLATSMCSSAPCVASIGVMTKSHAIGHPTSALCAINRCHRRRPSSPNLFPHSRTTRGRRLGSVAAIPSASAQIPSSSMSQLRMSISSRRVAFGNARAITTAPASQSLFRSRFRYRSVSPSSMILATLLAPTSQMALHRRSRHSRHSDAPTPYPANVSIPDESIFHLPSRSDRTPLAASMRAA
mmetsp:Transcript_9834/g.44748  ORF Transcript_9834/g.44748 Transcript_9834/m.44748 type:complete len:201 (-) Transcript_9834:590-1192(-)